MVRRNTSRPGHHHVKIGLYVLADFPKTLKETKRDLYQIKAWLKLGLAKQFHQNRFTLERFIKNLRYRTKTIVAATTGDVSLEFSTEMSNLLSKLAGFSYHTY